MKYFVVYIICVAHIVGRLAAGLPESTCNRPPVPDGGRYSPVKDSYSKGDNVKYSCEDKYLITDGKNLLCNGYNRWKGTFPTCDKAMVAANGFLHFQPKIDRNAIDNNTETCIKFFAPNESYVIPLNDLQLMVTAVQIIIKSKAESIKVFLADDYGEQQCNKTENISARQLQFVCNPTYYTKKITIENNSNVYMQDVLCEVKIICSTGSIPTMGIDAYIVSKWGVNTNAIDQNPATCVEGFSDESIYTIHLKQSEKIYAVRLTAKSDISMEIQVYEDRKWIECETQLPEKTDNQLVVSCPMSGEHKAEYVTVRNNDISSRDLCEVEIFIKSDTLQCSLERFGIEHGELFYNESHAWLLCDENYKALENVIKCEGRNRWSDTSRFKCEETSTPAVSQFNETSDLQRQGLLYGVYGGAGFLILLIFLLIICLYIRDKKKKTEYIMKDNELYEQNLTSSADDINYDYAMFNESAHFSSVNESVTINPSANNITTSSPQEEEYREAGSNEDNVNIAANDSQSHQQRIVILTDDWVESGYEYISFKT